MSRKILLIEDNEQNTYLMTFLLKSHGFTVSAAADGPAGIELAMRECPDLILLDIQLPGMNGYEVAAALRSSDSLKTIPVIAVTSYAMVGDREKAIEAGCTGYIEKPINPETFIKEMSAFLPDGEEGDPS